MQMQLKRHTGILAMYELDELTSPLFRRISQNLNGEPPPKPTRYGVDWVSETPEIGQIGYFHVKRWGCRNIVG